MGLITRVKTWASSNVLTAADLNAEFDVIQDEMNGSIEAANLASSAVTAAKIGTAAVETAKIDDLAVTTGKIAALAVTEAKLEAAHFTAHRVSVYQNSAQNINNNTWTRVNFGTESWDADNNWVSNQLKNTGEIMYWALDCMVTFAYHATGHRWIAIYKNDSLVKYGTAVNSTNASFVDRLVVSSANIYVDADDTVDIYVHQTSGTTLAIVAQPEETYLTAVRV